MTVSVRSLNDLRAGDEDRQTALGALLQLDAEQRLDAAAADPALFSLWRKSSVDLAEVAASFRALLPEGGSLLLHDLEASVEPVLLRPGQQGEAEWQGALKTLLTRLLDAHASSPRLLASRLDSEDAAWGDICNCEPESRSGLAVVVRARSGPPQAAGKLGQPEAEYRFVRESLSEGPVITLHSSGMRFVPEAEGLELARRALDFGSAPLQLLWVQHRDGLKFWGGRTLAVASENRVRRKYRLTGQGEVLGTGIAVGHGIVSGKVQLAQRPEEIRQGDLLLVDRLEPLWYSALSRAAGIITRQGGRTSHAALMAADLGIPAIVGCELPELQPGHQVTLDCEQASKGRVLDGAVSFEHREIDLQNPPVLPTDITLDMANPYRAFSLAQVPHRGIGLVRQEFIVGHLIGIHPAALLSPGRLDAAERRQIEERTADYENPAAFFVDRLCQGIATLATAVEGAPVILRLSDFKSDEYRNLLGGHAFEPLEPNPMLGLRGASRYLKHDFRPCLELECAAVRKVREEMGFGQVRLLVPFVRTPEEGTDVLETLDSLGLKRGEKGLQIYMMAELPSNLILAAEFVDLFDGFSVGTSDLTQLMLGVDRGSAIVGHLFDEGHPALLRALESALSIWNEADCYTGVCGKGVSSNFPLALWFARQGVDSIAVEPQRAADLWLMLHEELSGSS